MNANKNKYKNPKGLPIFRSVQNLYSAIDDIETNFRRDKRHTIWQGMSNTILDMCDLICIADCFDEKKSTALYQLIGKTARLNMMLEICSKKEYISKK